MQGLVRASNAVIMHSNMAALVKVRCDVRRSHLDISSLISKLHLVSKKCTTVQWANRQTMRHSSLKQDNWVLIMAHFRWHSSLSQAQHHPSFKPAHQWTNHQELSFKTNLNKREWARYAPDLPTVTPQLTTTVCHSSVCCAKRWQMWVAILTISKSLSESDPLLEEKCLLRAKKMTMVLLSSLELSRRYLWTKRHWPC